MNTPKMRLEGGDKEITTNPDGKTQKLVVNFRKTSFRMPRLAHSRFKKEKKLHVQNSVAESPSRDEIKMLNHPESIVAGSLLNGNIKAKIIVKSIRMGWIKTRLPHDAEPDLRYKIESEELCEQIAKRIKTLLEKTAEGL